MSTYGYIEGITGETISVIVVAKLVDGRYLVKRPDNASFGGNIYSTVVDKVYDPHDTGEESK